MEECKDVRDELKFAKQEVLRSCPSASHIILNELEKRVEVVRCRDCRHSEGGGAEEVCCWKYGYVKRSDGYCDEGVERG